MSRRGALLLFLCLTLAASPVAGQVIEFESGGLKYKTLTRSGVTIMFAHLPPQVRGYSALQVAVSNGSNRRVTIKPEDFSYRMPDGRAVQAGSAEDVISALIERASRDDVVKLVTAYEMGLYGIVRFRSTNGYEKRRQAALAEVNSTKIKAAAAASAIAFVAEELKQGASTDGVVFFYTAGKPLEGGNLTVRAFGETFDFQDEDEAGPFKQLKTRE